MIIETNLLSQDEQRFTGEEPASVLDLEHDLFIKVKGPIRYDFRACVVSSELVVRGVLEVELSCLCSRCAERFPYTVQVPAFLRSYQLASEKDLIDLTHDIREDILLDLPMVWVCSPACRGLCSCCGVNLNKHTCSCDRRETNTVWGALDQLNVK